MPNLSINRDYLGCFGLLPKRAKTRAVVIHHTCTTSPAKTREVLRKKGCSTHFEVDKDGTIYQYADLDRRCAHASAYNNRSIGVDITHAAGAEFPRVQLLAARKLLDWLACEFRLPRVVFVDTPCGFYFHRAVSDTECPQNFPADIFGSEYDGPES